MHVSEIIAWMNALTDAGIGDPVVEIRIGEQIFKPQSLELVVGLEEGDSIADADDPVLRISGTHDRNLEFLGGD